MLRLGLCCIFANAPIHFRTTTATHFKSLAKLSALILDNANALEQALHFCNSSGIYSFRVTSRFFPLYTHPKIGYLIDQLPNQEQILKQLKHCKELAKKLNMRLTLHPDQFVVLSTLHEKVLTSSLREIEYHALLADLIGADVINIHAGGAYGNKTDALKRFEDSFYHLSPSAQTKLTLENDDKSYTPSDLLPLCERLKIPFVYDIHHHRCLPDEFTEEEITKRALLTWNREPLFHLSSPLNGWAGANPSSHHDYIDIADFPRFWLKIDPLTIEIEAKAKELAVLKLISELNIKTST